VASEAAFSRHCCEAAEVSVYSAEDAKKAMETPYWMMDKPLGE
jgi:hypothetical protein